MILTANIHHPKVERADVINDQNMVAVTLSPGGYASSVALIFAGHDEALAFARSIIAAVEKTFPDTLSELEKAFAIANQERGGK